MSDAIGYYDRDGKPITMEQWAALYEDRDYKIVSKTQLGDVLISTVWLGIDHRFGFGELPVIFETMIFPESDYQERYATEAAALAGHDQAVEHVRSGDYAAQCRGRVEP